MKSSYTYEFTPAAETDLDDIVRYVAQRLFNAKAVLDFKVVLHKKIEQLRSFPESGSIIGNNGVLRKSFVGNFTRLYIVWMKSESVLLL